MKTPAPRFRWTAYLLFLLAWTAALILPTPNTHFAGVSDEHLFTFSKFVHVSGYAALTVLGLSAPWPARWRGGAFLVPLVHAPFTEFMQWLLEDWAGRDGNIRDVFLDYVGVVAGLLMYYAGWRIWQAVQEEKRSNGK